MKITVTMPDGSVWQATRDTTPPPVIDLPDIVAFPGTKVIDATENGHWARIRHDDPAPRIEGSNNNEVQVYRRLRADGLKVDPNTKITMKIGATALMKLVYSLVSSEPLQIQWEDYCRSLMTDWAWSRFIAKGYWCYDTGYPTFTMLGAGGNDVHVLDITSDNWARIEYQDYALGPNYNVNPYDHRWLFSKQWLVGGKIGDPHWVVDKGYVGGVGDVNIGIISPVPVYLSTWKTPTRSGQQGIEFWPDLPLTGKFVGYDTECTITKYGLHKTNTYGWVDAGDQSGWRMLEEMVVSGDPNDYAVGGTWMDRVVHFTPWLENHPPTYIGWTRAS